jgi:hypothetical protein
MIHPIFIRPIELIVLMLVIVAFVTAFRSSASFRTYLATVSWNG